MLRGFLLSAGIALAWGAQAQTTIVAPSPAQRCLTRGEALLGTPEYPQDANEAKAGGHVAVELEFGAQDKPPRVLKLEAKSDAGASYASEFEASVRKFIAAYRVPCLAVGETSNLRQEFVFLPHDSRGVTMMASVDPDEARREKLRACLRRPSELPDYPHYDLRIGREGTVVTRLSFNGPDQTPQVAVLDNAGSEYFAGAVMGHAQKMRMPCHDGHGPVDFLMLYIFRIEDGGRLVLKDMPFLTLLRGLKGIRQAQVYFDFNTMGCPFDVHVELWQPHAANRVGEVGAPNPERRFFLDWLSRQQLELKPRELNGVIGQGARVSVPCTVLNLGTRSGGGASQ